jgi:large subunit ribosomal protein L15
MELGNLKPAAGSVKNRKRVGRGNASGHGRTSGRGRDGYHSRSGWSTKIHYEGGQTPLMRRLPKRGFSNYRFKKSVQIINLGKLASLGLDKIGIEEMLNHRAINKSNAFVKVLGVGELTAAMEVSAHMFSQSAIDKIEKAGGKVIYL